MAVAGPVTETPPGGAPTVASYRFARSPRWILLHAVAVALLALMVFAGFWQLSRLHDKQARNQLLDARAVLATVDVTSVLGARDSPADAEALLYRPVTATGRYLVGEEVLVHSRSRDGRPGAWVLTPLQVSDGAVVVNRGWIPANDTSPTLPAGAEAPPDVVTVSGVLAPGETRGRFGAQDPGGGRLSVLARADLARLQDQVGVDLYPAIVQAGATEPAGTGELPAPLPPPERTEGPHRGYAGQWFVFAALWVIGYPLLVRRSAHRSPQP